MTAEKKTLEIGAYTYVIRHAPASVALRAATTLMNGLAPLVNGFRRGKGGELDRILLGVAEACSDPALGANLERLCDLFKPYTQVVWTVEGQTFSRDLGGERGIYEEHFAGRFDALLAWLRAAVEFDLGGFLAEAKAKIAQAKVASASASAAESKSESPPVAATTG